MCSVLFLEISTETFSLSKKVDVNKNISTLFLKTENKDPWILDICNSTVDSRAQNVVKFHTKKVSIGPQNGSF